MAGRILFYKELQLTNLGNCITKKATVLDVHQVVRKLAQGKLDTILVEAEGRTRLVLPFGMSACTIEFIGTDWSAEEIQRERSRIIHMEG